MWGLSELDTLFQFISGAFEPRRAAAPLINDTGDRNRFFFRLNLKKNLKKNQPQGLLFTSGQLGQGLRSFAKYIKTNH